MARYKVGKRTFSLIKDDCRLSNENSFALVTTDTELNAPLTNSMSRTGHDIFIFLCLCRVDYEVALAWRNSSFPHRFHLDLWFDKHPTFVVNPYNNVGFTVSHAKSKTFQTDVTSDCCNAWRISNQITKQNNYNKSRATDTVVHDGAYTLFHSMLKGKFPAGRVQLQY